MSDELKQINVRLPVDLIQALKDHAKKSGCERWQDFVTEILRQGVELHRMDSDERSYNPVSDCPQCAQRAAHDAETTQIESALWPWQLAERKRGFRDE